MANRVSKLLKYGIGELVLLVLGILIALQINNWNDQRKSDGELDTILSIVSKDLNVNLSEARALIEHYSKEMDQLDTLFAAAPDEQNLSTCKRCFTVNTGFADLVIKKRGLDLMMNYKSNHGISEDSLVMLIDAFYTSMMTYNATMADNINAEVLDNLSYYRDHFDWYEKYIAGQLDSAMINDIMTNTVCRNRILHYHVLIKSNYLQLLKGFEHEGSRILGELETRLGKR